ncbi:MULTISPECIES: hypothetical protein [Bacillus]|uniref:hypothetical protein n=1 Tax=Bacillus TaxID=1386 RepID=UPI0002D2250C|nr:MULTISPECIES: hypothetical protein [Bacillus]MEB9335666.1 hypothetical protein [Bacillus cereus]CCW04378.1 hypothetical protein EBGED10_10950 [Bacillus sp. GeD10]HEF1857144.1 hypothetical protein [Bacillus cereus]HEF1869502.1 hypothetical protein [Bacillus cereus]HEF1880055.1 hypothetical protein [Bacillus cereus]
MKIWLEGKRIFEEETDYGSKYYVFPRDKMQKNVTLHSYIVKKGAFNQPCKWIYAEDLPKTERIIPVKDFDYSQYDCFIFDDYTLGKDVQKVLSSYNIDIQQDMKEFLKLEVLPEEAVKGLKILFEEKEYYNKYPEDFLFCESYDYKCNEMEKRFIVDPDDNIGVSITYDQTDWFGRQYLVEVYAKEVHSQTHYVLKNDWDYWYKYYPGDSNENYWIIEEIDEEQIGNFSFEEYQPVEIEKRDLPEKAPEIDLSKYFAPDTVYDFYYSEKMFIMRYNLDQRVATVNINGSREFYTEMVREGEELTSNWDDMKHIGRTTYGEADIQHPNLTRKDILERMFGKRDLLQP